MTAPTGLPPRSLLYVPADNPRFLARAHARGADMVILDLEDGVPPEAKDAARAGLATWVAQIARTGVAVAVRINAGPERRAADARAAAAAGAQAVVLPKADPAALAETARLLAATARETAGVAGLIAIVEDAAGLLALREIAASAGLWGLVCGSEDLALSLGAEPLPEVLALPKQLVHHAARAHGLWSFGLLRSIADWSDAAALADAVQAARRMGFDGATCVHPDAVPVLNAGFLPPASEVEAAARLLAAARGHDGPFRLDGRMVDAPVIERARRTLARAARRG